MVKNILSFPSNFWPDLHRGNTEKGYTGKEKGPLNGDLEVKYESHKDISLSEGAGIQITELSLELKSAVK